MPSLAPVHRRPRSCQTQGVLSLHLGERYICVTREERKKKKNLWKNKIYTLRKLLLGRIGTYSSQSSGEPPNHHPKPPLPETVWSNKKEHESNWGFLYSTYLRWVGSLRPFWRLRYTVRVLKRPSLPLALNPLSSLRWRFRYPGYVDLTGNSPIGSPAHVTESGY